MPGAVIVSQTGRIVRSGLNTAAEYAQSPFKMKGGSPSFFAFFLYIFVIITFRIPIGTECMVIALLMLPMEGNKLHVPSVALWTFAMVGWSFYGYGQTLYPDIVLLTMTEFAKVCLVMLVAVNVISSRSRMRMLLAGMMIFFLCYPIRGTLQNYLLGETNHGRAVWNGTFSNPNDLAGYCVLQMGVSLAVLEVEKKVWLKRVAIACSLLLPLVVVLTASRGAFIALVVFLIVSMKRHWAIVKSKLWVVIMLGMVITYVGSDKVFSRLATIDEAVAGKTTMEEDGGSAKQRIEIWRVARAIIAEHPIFGVGIGGYNEAHYEMANRPGFALTALGLRDTHSTYLNIMAELGFVGFGCFVCLIGVTLNRARKARKEAGNSSPALTAQLIWLEIGLYGFLVAGIWGTYGRLVPMYVHVAIVWCTAGLLQQETARLKRGAEPARQMRGMRKPVAVVPLAGARG
ncbi:MAG: O-antigen ligase family protein [bacterium]